jgi:hypothetical protein
VFRTRIYDRVEALQADLDTVIEQYTTQRPHQGRWCDGKTPRHTCIDSVALAREKRIA